MHAGRAAFVVVASSLSAWGSLGGLASCSEPYEGVTPAANEAAAADAGDGGAQPIVSDAASTGFCKTLARKSVLCADFDDGQPLTALFGGQGGRVFVDENVAVSPPGSLRAVGAGSFVERTFETSPRPPYVVSFAMRIAIPDGGAPPPPTLLPIRFQDDGVADCTFNVELTPADAYVSVAATVSDGGRGVRTYPFYRWPQAGVWSTIRLEIANGVAATRVALALDGIPVLPLTDTHCPALTGKPKLTLGVVFGDGAEVSYDDVVVEAN